VSSAEYDATDLMLERAEREEREKLDRERGRPQERHRPARRDPAKGAPGEAPGGGRPAMIADCGESAGPVTAALVSQLSPRHPRGGEA